MHANFKNTHVTNTQVTNTHECQSVAHTDAQNDVDMRVSLATLSMKNPLTVASGTFASGREYADFVDISRLGAITTKGVSACAWEGNDQGRLAETPSGILNSIGLQNKGAKHFIENDLAWLKQQQTRVIVNVCGHSYDEYVQALDALEQANGIDAYEINISCPNVDAGGMALGTQPKAVERIVSLLRKRTRKTLIIKLTPNVTDIAEIARAAESAGADSLSLINTLLGMAIDVKRRRPILSRVVGGLSGPAIKPVALRCVWQVHKAVDIPILGMGGAASGTDVAEFMLAGASAVAIGTENFVDPCATMRILDELYAYAREQHISHISELIGGLEC